MKRLLKIFRRPPDFIIGGPDNPYMLRWWVIPRNPFFNIYLHKFLRDDDDRALHDHPWASCSIILKGGYLEHLPGDEVKYRRRGNVVCRRARQAHRIRLRRAYWLLQPNPCETIIPAWSLFITGPRVREWGFHCPQGWRHWKEFTNPHDSGQVGRGCE